MNSINLYRTKNFKLGFTVLFILICLGIFTCFFFELGRSEISVSNQLETVPINNSLIPLDNTTVLSQEFIPEYNFLRYIEVIVVDLPEDQQGNLLVSLLDAENRSIVFKEIPLSSIVPGEYYRIDFSTIVQSQKIYQLKISANNLLDGTPRLVCVEPSLSLSENETLFLNGENIDFALVNSFGYRYETFSFNELINNGIKLATFFVIFSLSFTFVLLTVWWQKFSVSIQSSIQNMGIDVLEILLIFTIFSSFLLSALINGGSSNSLIKNKIFFCCIFLIPFFLLGALFFNKVIASLKNLYFYLLTRKILLIILFISLFVRLLMFSTIPKWDGGEYYYRLGTACQNFEFTFKSYFENFRLCGHSTLGFSLLMSIGEFLNPRGVIGYLTVNLVLTVICLICIYNILEHIFIDNKRAVISITAIVSINPLFLGTFSYINVDYTMALFFIYMICSHINRKYILFLFWAWMTTQTKETGLLLVSGYLIFAVLLILKRSKGNLKDRFYNLVAHPIFLCSFIEFLLFLVNILWQGSFITWSRGAEAKWLPNRSDYMGINIEYLWNRLLQIFILNFSWIVILAAIISLVYGLYKKKQIRFYNSVEEYIIQIGIIGAAIFYLFFNLFYITACLYRYLIILIIIIIFLSLCLIWKLLPHRYSCAFSGILIVLFIIQSYFDFDPISNYIFPTLDTGKNQKLFTTYSSNYFGDGLINNYSYTWIDNLYNKMLSEINYEEDMTIFLPGTESAGTHINGNGTIYRIGWNTKTEKRVIVDDKILSSDAIIPIHTFSTDKIFDKFPYAYKESEQLINVNLPDKGIVVFLPHYQEKEENILDCLSNYYYIGKKKQVENWNGILIYYEILKKDSFKGYSLSDFSEDRYYIRKPGNSDSLENYYYRYYPTETTDGDTYVNLGDVINIECKAYYNNQQLPIQDIGSYSGNIYEVTVGSNVLLEGLEDALLFKSVGDAVKVTVTIPDDYIIYSDYIGQDILFEIEILNISGKKDLKSGNEEINTPIINRYNALKNKELQLKQQNKVIEIVRNISGDIYNDDTFAISSSEREFESYFYEYLRKSGLDFYEWSNKYWKAEEDFEDAKSLLIEAVSIQLD